MNKLTEGSCMQSESSRRMSAKLETGMRNEVRNETKIDRPILAEDETEQIRRTLQAAINERAPVQLSYYKDGFIKQSICYPSCLDSFSRQLIVRDAYGMKKNYDFRDVIDAQFGPQ
ncbi:MAG: YolD-like family protein [Sporolactobacillus sp.]